MNFAVPVHHKVRIKEKEKIDKYLDLARELKNIKVAVIYVIVGALGMIPKYWKKETGRTGDQRKNGAHPDHSIVKISKNTWKSPGDLSRLAVT